MVRLEPGWHNMTSADLQEELRIIDSRERYYIAMNDEVYFNSRIDELNARILALQNEVESFYAERSQADFVLKTLAQKRAEIHAEIEDRKTKVASDAKVARVPSSKTIEQRVEEKFAKLPQSIKDQYKGREEDLKALVRQLI